jgi:hypothetical protein
MNKLYKVKLKKYLKINPHKSYIQYLFVCLFITGVKMSQITFFRLFVFIFEMAVPFQQQLGEVTYGLLATLQKM